jgi:uncharacterized protein (DUF1810 family)
MPLRSILAAMNDLFDLQRFVDAQTDRYAIALSEIRRATKRSHWMWFIFPQIAGLGTSAMAQRYAIGSMGEARAFLAHSVLGPRYRECVAALQDLTGATAEAVFGAIDAIKLRSSLTLFAETGDERLILAALERWCGDKDPKTLALLANESDVNTRRH